MEEKIYYAGITPVAVNEWRLGVRREAEGSDGWGGDVEGYVLDTAEDEEETAAMMDADYNGEIRGLPDGAIVLTTDGTPHEAIWAETIITPVDILMEDGCSRDEAERHLEKGCLIWSREDFVSECERVGGYLLHDAFGSTEEDAAECQKMIDTGVAPPDWSVVDMGDGGIYILSYCL